MIFEAGQLILLLGLLALVRSRRDRYVCPHIYESLMLLLTILGASQLAACFAEAGVIVDIARQSQETLRFMWMTTLALLVILGGPTDTAVGVKRLEQALHDRVVSERTKVKMERERTRTRRQEVA